MHTKKPHLISSLLFLMFFLDSCIFQNPQETAQITITFPSTSSKAVSDKNDIDHYGIQFFPIPEQYYEISQTFFMGKYPEKFNTPEFFEFESYYRNNYSLIQVDNIAPANTFSKNVDPGIWLVEVFASTKEHEVLFHGNQLVTLEKDENKSVEIVLRRVNKNSGIAGEFATPEASVFYAVADGSERTGHSGLSPEDPVGITQALLLSLNYANSHPGETPYISILEDIFMSDSSIYWNLILMGELNNGEKCKITGDLNDYILSFSGNTNRIQNLIIDGRNSKSGIKSTGNLEISNCEIQNCTSDSTNGAGINFSGTGSLKISNTTITYCSSAAHGGGISFEGNTLFINNTTISNCSCYGHGGGIYISNSGNAIEISNSSSISSCSGEMGGGIYSNRSINLYLSEISGCTASAGDGASLYLDKSLDASICLNNNPNEYPTACWINADIPLSGELPQILGE